ncbi:Protein MCM10 [Gossypium australe]|uniref:Protein MCM10 n=1 Tax=Gossypium australe TaxID=47621 RepID=A0A5B6VW16_9ROSI|nr:Protein MCM10 [Gossypium australe]
MDPNRAVANDVESYAPALAQGIALSEFRNVSSSHGGESNEAFFQMMNKWFTQFVRTNSAAQQPPPPPNPQSVPIAPQVVELQRLNKPLVDKIRKYGAEEFRATVDDDPEGAEFWLENTIRVFDELSCTPRECLKCDVSLMRDTAYQWLNTLVSVVPREKFTWEFFLTEFWKKYICQIFLDQKHKEFLELKQGRMTVIEYEREFVRLSKYAREYVSTEEIIACKAEELSNEKRRANSEARDSRKRSMSKPYQSSSKKSKDSYTRPNASIGYLTRDRGKQYSSLKAQATSVSSVGISNPLGKYVLVGKVCKNCPLMTRDYYFLADLMLLPFDAFDVILDMDWLTLHDAVVNYKLKTIELKCQNSEILRIESDESNTTVSDSKIESVPVVYEYSDVFPEELLGLPPIREVEFSIELVRGTSSISVAPYRMAPTELKELKAKFHLGVR